MTAAVALATLRAEAHVSVSALTTYLRCPEQYRHRYVSHTPASHRPTALAFGSAIHHALAHFYRQLRDDKPEPTVDELRACFGDAWTTELATGLPVLFDKNDSAASLFELGVPLLERFHDVAPRPYRVIGVEEPFSIELDDPETGGVLPERLVGVFDAVIRDEDGSARILEHKTAARRFTQTKLAFDLQPTAYAIAAPLVGLGHAAITFQVLLKTKKPAFVTYDLTRTERDQADFRRIAAGVLSAVRAGAFWPVRDWWCASCPFQAHCVAG